jgi:hypothetical protein
MQAEDAVQVFKRGRARKDGKGEAVSITLSLLQDLRSVTLPAAAKTLGLSPTALKGACRKLGITRWPYWAGRGIRAGAFDTAKSAHNGQCLPVGLWDSVPSVRVRQLCDAGTQTELSIADVYACEVPALVDAEDALDVREDGVGVWWVEGI